MKKLFGSLPLLVSLCCFWGCQNQQALSELEAIRAQAQIEEQNKQIVLRWFSEVNRDNFDQLFQEFFASNCQQRMPPNAEPRDPEEFRQLVEYFYTAFPEVSHTVEDVFAEGDKVVARVTVRTVHEGEFLGVPATNRELEWTAIAIFRFSEEKVQERWEIADQAGLMEQLGLGFVPKD